MLLEAISTPGKGSRPFSNQQTWVPVDRRRAITRSGSCPNSARHSPARSSSVWHFPRASARSMSRCFRGGFGRVVCSIVEAGHHPCPILGPHATCGAYVVRPAAGAKERAACAALPSRHSVTGSSSVRFGKATISTPGNMLCLTWIEVMLPVSSVLTKRTPHRSQNVLPSFSPVLTFSFRV